MGMVFNALHVLVGLAWLACFIIVVVKMFQAGDTGLGIASAVGFFICFLGVLLAYIMGWVNLRKYGSKNIMFAWTGIIILGMFISIAQMILAPAQPIVIPVGR